MFLKLKEEPVWSDAESACGPNPDGQVGEGLAVEQGPGASEALPVGREETSAPQGEGAPSAEEHMPFLFATAPLIEQHCRAITWTHSEEKPVFAQCRRSCRLSGVLCQFHEDRAKQTGGVWKHGHWDPSSHHASVPAQMLARAKKHAQRRADRAGLLPRGERPDDGKRVARWFRTQREYVSLSASQRGQLREWGAMPIALLPHPCMLCRASFVQKEDWRAHVRAEHHSVEEYRKRLFFLTEQIENMRPSRPQLWRHAVEAFAEEFVTGCDDWPKCNFVPQSVASYAWPSCADPSVPLPDLQQYRTCARKILVQLNPIPWHAQLSAEADVRRFAMEVSREELAPSSTEALPADGGGVWGVVGKLILSRMEQEGRVELRGGGYRVPPGYLLSIFSEQMLWRIDVRAVASAEPVFQEEAVIDEFLAAALPDQCEFIQRCPAALAWAARLLSRLEERNFIERCEEGAPLANGARAPRAWRRVLWWRADDPGRSVQDTSVRLDALGPVPQGDAPQDNSRRNVRRRTACAVCARFGWERDYVYLWEQPEGSGQSCLIDPPAFGRAAARLFVDDEASAGRGANRKGPLDPRDAIADFLSPEAYWRRWCFKSMDGRQCGIPLQELRASAVRDPGTGKLWLLHRKLFRFIWNEKLQQEAADPCQSVPVCAECKRSLRGPRPYLCRYALANDLWMGKLPAPLRGLSEGAWMLLALARPLIRRFTCYCDSDEKRCADRDEMIKAFVGNVAAFAQGDGGSLLSSLPPSAAEMAERLAIVFVGSEQDCRKAFIASLGVEFDSFKRAYDCLHLVNALYERVAWDTEAAKERLGKECNVLGLPNVLGPCVRVASDDKGIREAHVEQAGPADAQQDGEEVSPEREGAVEAERVSAEDRGASDFVVGVADGDVQLHADKHMQHAESLLRKQCLLLQEKMNHERAVRETCGEGEAENGMETYTCEGYDAELKKNRKELRASLGRAKANKMREELHEAQKAFELEVPPPGVCASAYWLNLDEKSLRLVVPSARAGVNAFDPSVWSAMDPRSFPYGDGVFGIERRTKLSYRSWSALLLERDELEYEGGADWDALLSPCAEVAGAPPSPTISPQAVDVAAAGLAPPVDIPAKEAARVEVGKEDMPARDGADLPRWRRSQNLLIMMYDMWRRRMYVSAGRLMADKTAWHEALREAGEIAPEELWTATAALGKNAGFKELLSKPDVPPRVKQVVKTLLTCMHEVVGSNAHRTTLRHTNKSYCLLFGPPLVFTTPNVNDPGSVVMRLMYDGATVTEWRLLEENTPEMPSRRAMLRRVAADPVSQAIFFDLMLRLFLKHVLGVNIDRLEKDGVASEYGRGVLGVVLAFLGPIETQGRGGLHAHIHAWLQRMLDGAMLARLRAGELDEALKRALLVWREAVFEQVASMQFDSVEEVARQIGVPKCDVRAVPNQASQQEWTFDGKVETAEPRLDELRDPKHWGASWATAEPEGPARRRPYVALQPEPELDPHNYENRKVGGRLVNRSVAHRQCQTGACGSLLPQYRRKPPYVTLANGRSAFVTGIRPELEAKRWRWVFFKDARMCVIRSHLHKCQPTCYKKAHSKDDKTGCKLCRFNFYHVYKVHAPGRRPFKKCNDKRCPFMRAKRRVRISNRWESMHPFSCPARALKGRDWKCLRSGKDLVLPTGRAEATDGSVWETKLLEQPPEEEWREDLYCYAPKMCMEERYKRYGSCEVLRYNGSVGSTGPVAQTTMRCNLDLQMKSLVFPVPQEWADAAAEVRANRASLFKPCATSLAGGGLVSTLDDSEADGEEEEEPWEEEEECGECAGPDEGCDSGDGTSNASEAGGDDEKQWGEGVNRPARNESVADQVLFSVERLFRDADNAAHYTGDYMTKWGELVGEVLPEVAAGVDRLRAVQGQGRMDAPEVRGVYDSYEQKKTEGGASYGKAAREEAVERGRATIIRLETSANRCTLKKLPEMAFQLLHDHECYMSHSTWTLWGKYPMCLGIRAQEKHRRRLLGKCVNDLDDHGRFLADYGGGSDEEAGDAADIPEQQASLFVGRAQEGVPNDMREDAFGGCDGERPEDREREDHLVIRVARPVRQWDRWFARGAREPLASMGLYHYVMYVEYYSRFVDEEDFVFYWFADVFAECGRQVQKLRVDEVFKVPKLHGITIPSATTDQQGKERNALMKSMLFRPMSVPSEMRDLKNEEEKYDIIAACFLDGQASFVPGWTAWFEQQRALGERFSEKQRRAGKRFTIEDIDVSAALEEEDAAREQPSAAEFMAHITVEVVTNIDMSADSKARPRDSTANAGDFDCDGTAACAHRDASNLLRVEGVPAGPAWGDPDAPDGPPVDPVGKRVEPFAPVPQEDVQGVAFFDGTAAPPQMGEYVKEFRSGAEGALRPRGNVAAEERGFGDLSLDDEDFAHAEREMEKLFDYKKKTTAGAGPDAQGSATAGVVGLGDGECEPAEAYFALGADDTPRTYAERLVRELAEDKETPIVLGREQLAFLALVVNHMEEQLRRKAEGLGWTQRVFLLIGQGGSGKSELLGIVQKITQRVWPEGSYIAMASSNSAARGIGGDTFHSCLHLHGEAGLGLPTLSRGVTNEMKDEWRDVMVCVIDEISLVSCRLFGGASYRICLARRETHSCQPSLYMEPGHLFGGIPIVILAGDFLQLCPFDTVGRATYRASLIESSAIIRNGEHENGKLCFRKAVLNSAYSDVCILSQTYRFRDSVTKKPCSYLPRLFEYMRAPGGLPMPDDLWERLKQCVCTGPEDERFKKYNVPGEAGMYEIATMWEAVGRMMQYRPAREAQQLKKMLVYVQAIDQPMGGAKLTREEFRSALQQRSLTHTGRLSGLGGFYVGMRVRLCSKLSQKLRLVHDCTGAVIDIRFHSQEFLWPQDDWRENREHEAWARGFVRTRKMPECVFVKFDGLHLDLGYGPGVVPIKPISRTWKFKTHGSSADRRQRDVTLRRIQIPLLPERVRTCQTAQGMGMDAALLLLTRPKAHGEDDHWMHLYVMLSRLRTIDGLMIYELPERKLFERGPPRWLHEWLELFDARSQDTRARAQEIMQEFQWGGEESPTRALASAPTPDESGPNNRPIESGRRGSSGAPESGEQERAVRRRLDGRDDVRERVGAGSAGRGSVAERPQSSTFARMATSLPTVDDRNVASRSRAPEGVGQERRVRRRLDGPGAREGVGAGHGSVAQRPQSWNFTSTATSSPTVPERNVALLRSLPNPLSERIYRIPGGVGQTVALHYADAAAAPVGVRNIGNTCFVAAAVQVFLRLESVFRLLAAHVALALPSCSGACVACCLWRQACVLRGTLGSGEARVAELAREGAFGSAYNRLEDRQCDALEFLESMVTQLELADLHQMSSAEVAQFGERTVWKDEVLGCLFRRRSRCARGTCEGVMDVLEYENVIKLQLPPYQKRAYVPPAVPLARCWELTFKEEKQEGVNCFLEACPCTTRQRQSFLEKEPPVLIIALARAERSHAGRRTKKNHTPISYPRTLDFMRSGSYEFSGGMYHTGETVLTGHYKAVCRLADTATGDQQYGIFNDEEPVDRISWEQLQNETAWQMAAYVLVYIRAGQSMIVEDTVPEERLHRRGASSMDILQRNREERERCVSLGARYQCSCVARVHPFFCCCARRSMT